jgi:hypothetical protein
MANFHEDFNRFIPFLLRRDVGLGRSRFAVSQRFQLVGAIQRRFYSVPCQQSCGDPHGLHVSLQLVQISLKQQDVSLPLFRPVRQAPCSGATGCNLA